MDYESRINKIKNDIEVINNKLKNKNLNKISEINDDEIILLKQIMNQHEIKNKIIEYEFTNTKPYIIDDVKELINFFIESLKKYQYILGGKSIEDDEWIIKHYNEECRFKLKDRMSIIYNTIGINNIYDTNTFDFMEKMLNFIKQFTTQIQISLKVIKDDTNDIIWVVYLFQYK